jgi:uncharacterized membrane protein YeaQ/YmgE (transglycosylase-associated protein family)
MTITLAEVLTWLIVGSLAGSWAGMLVKRRKEGFGRLMNLGVGLVGALIGGLVLKAFHVQWGILAQVTVSLQEVLAGFLGALVFLVVVWGIQKFRGAR